MTKKRQTVRAVQESRDVRARPARLVIAAVRPGRPNPSVLETAVRLAQHHEAHLLVLATVRPVPIDYTHVMHPEMCHLAEAVAAELFADAAELLVREDVQWSACAFTGHPARHIRQLAKHADVRAVVAGDSRRRRPWWRRISGQPVLVTA